MISLNLDGKNVPLSSNFEKVTPSNEIYHSSFNPPIPFLGLETLEIKNTST